MSRHKIFKRALKSLAFKMLKWNVKQLIKWTFFAALNVMERVGDRDKDISKYHYCLRLRFVIIIIELFLFDTNFNQFGKFCLVVNLCSSPPQEKSFPLFLVNFCFSFFLFFSISSLFQRWYSIINKQVEEETKEQAKFQLFYQCIL